MVAYRYALDEDGKIVSIDDISIETEVRSFICGECREKLAPRAVNSNKVTAHFYHPYSDTSTDRICSGESYLHWISKELLAESLQDKEPFLLKWETSSSCENNDADWGMCFKELQHNIDLIKEYPIVSIEKRDGSFIPDILLSNEKGDKLYIEIYNNSPCSIEKRNSGNKIIEIKVTNETDIENIINTRSINEKYEVIELINFNLDKIEEYFDCGGKCHFITEIEETPPLPKILSVFTEDRDLESIKFISEQSISYFELFFNIERQNLNLKCNP